MERFQDAVQRYVMMTAMIESMLRDMGGDASRFRRLARYLAEGDSGILLLAIAPKGAEPIACPGDGAAQVLRFLDSLKLQDADSPQPSGRTAVFGPLGLEDGQAALAARRPIFLMGTCGMPYFWGFRGSSRARICTGSSISPSRCSRPRRSGRGASGQCFKAALSAPSTRRSTGATFWSAPGLQACPLTLVGRNLSRGHASSSGCGHASCSWAWPWGVRATS